MTLICFYSYFVNCVMSVSNHESCIENRLNRELAELLHPYLYLIFLLLKGLFVFFFYDVQTQVFDY